MIFEKIDKTKKRRFKRNIYISYRYAKHYSPWALLLFILLLSGVIIQKNYINKPIKISVLENTKSIKAYKNIPVNTLTSLPDDTKLKAQKEQPLVEKKKNELLAIKPVNSAAPHVNDTKLQSLTEQLLAEKKKNEQLSKSLNNQEQQLVSALNNINNSFSSAIKNTSSVTEKVTLSSATTINQTDYYNKVKASLNKNEDSSNNIKVLKKRSISNEESSLPDIKNIEG